MNKFILFSFCVLFFFSSLKSQTISNVLRFKERVFSFNRIEEKNGIVSHEFEFTNNSRKVVYINDVTSGCGCVRFDFPKGPIKSNETSKIKVYYNPAYRPGFFSKEIVVLSNGNANYNRIWIKGTVAPAKHSVAENYPYEYESGFFMNMEVMAFGTVCKGCTKTMKLKLANDKDSSIKVSFVVVGGNSDIKFTSPQLMKAHEEKTVPITYQCSKSFLGVKKLVSILSLIIRF